MESINRLLFTDRNPLKEKLIDALTACGIGLGLALLGLEYFGVLTY
jgi:hypothetical protein